MQSRSLYVVAICASLFLSSGCGRQTAAAPLAFVSNNAHRFWTFAQKGTEAAAKETGVRADFKMPPNGKGEEQQQFIDDMLVKGLKGVAISPNDAANMSDYLAGVNKKVPVIAVDNDIPDVKARRCYIGTDNYLAGRAAGELVVKAAPAGGKIVIFVGSMDATNAVERRQGVLDVLASIDQKKIGKKTSNDPNLTLGKYTLLDTRTDDTKEDFCQQRCEDALTKNPDVVAVVGLWEYNPPALLRAVKNTGSNAAIIGFDENADTLRGVKDGKIIGTVVQAPYKFGYDSMKILAGLIKQDESVLKSYNPDADNRIYIPHQVITSENVDKFSAEVNKILGK